MGADMGGMKGEDDAGFGYSGGDEFVGDAVIEAVVVEPNLLIADFGIKDKVMNPFDVVPSFINDEVAGLVLVDDQLGGGGAVLV